MNILLWSAFAILVFIEISKKVNTDNIYEKLAMGIIAIGILLNIAALNRPIFHNLDYVIILGIILYFGHMAYRCYQIKYNRRSNDRDGHAKTN